MRLPFERFGSLFTRFTYDEPYKLISVIGGLELKLEVLYKNKPLLADINFSLELSDLLLFVRRRITDIEFDELVKCSMISSLPSITSTNNDESIISPLPLIKAVSNTPTTLSAIKAARIIKTSKIAKTVKSNIKFNLIFSMNYSMLDYIEDSMPRHQWFKAVYIHMKENKADYRFVDITDILTKNSSILTFTCIFDNMDIIKDFLIYKIYFVDSSSSLYYNYIPIDTLTNNKILIETATYVLKSSILKIIIKITDIPYQIIINYEEIHKIEEFINEFINYIKLFSLSSSIQYKHDSKNQIIVIYNILCESQELKPNYLSAYRIHINPLFINILNNMIYKHEVLTLYDVD